MSQKHQKGYMPWDRTGNRLLVQSQLGKNKPSDYDLPDQTHIYGKSTFEDPEHANEMMYKWKYHHNSDNANNGKEKDLIQTNKKALNNMMHTSSQFSQYRKSNTLFKTAREGSNMIKISLPEKSHAYGKPGDLEDPIKLVIANDYGQMDKIARHSFYETQSRFSSHFSNQRKLSCHITKNHKLVKEATAQRMQKFNWLKKDDYWKLSKFLNANAKVDHKRKLQQTATKKSQKGSDTVQPSFTNSVKEQ